MPNKYNRYGGKAIGPAQGSFNGLDAGPSVTGSASMTGSVQITGVMLMAALVVVVLLARSLEGAAG